MAETFEDDGAFPMDACTGQLIKWEAGSIWDTYAYPHHDDDKIGWTPIGYEGGNYIRLQSKSCHVFSSGKTRMLYFAPVNHLVHHGPNGSEWYRSEERRVGKEC